MPPNDQREIVVNGVRFMHAGDAAAQYGFHADYIARLARQGKISGRRVGKRWYIEQNSIRGYLHTPDSHPLPASASFTRHVADTVTIRPHTSLASHVSAHIRRAHTSRARARAVLTVLSALALLSGAYGAALNNHTSQVAAASNSLFDTFASVVYHTVCPLFSDCEAPHIPIQQATTANQTKPTVVTHTQTAHAGTTTQTVVHQTITNPVVERIVERVVPSSYTSGLTEATLNQRLSEISDKFTKLVYGGSVSAPTLSYIASPPASGGVFNQIAISQKIDQLSSVSVSDSTWRNGSISGASVAASDLSASGAASFATTTVGGSLTVTAGTANTNPFVVNNNLGTTIFAIANDGTLTTNVASTTSSYSSLLVTGNATATNLVVLDTASSTNILATNATTTAATSTTLYATIGRFASGFFESLNATIATIASLTTTNLVATNSTTTAATSTTLTVFTPPVAPAFTATSTTIASVLPFASTTGISVSGTASTTNLVVSGTATLGLPLLQVSGGTSFSTYASGDILYADNIGTLAKLPIGGAGQVLKVQAGLPAWGTDNTGGGGGGSGYNMWATTTLNLIYPVDTAYPVAIGSNATATANSIFEVSGQQYISSKLGIATTSPVTALSVEGNGYLTGGLGIGLYNTTAGTLQTSGNATIGGNLAAQQATSTSLAVTNVTSALHLANGTGGVIAYTGTSCTNQFIRGVNGAGVATCVSVNLGTDVTGTLAVSNGGTGTSTPALFGHLLSWNGTNWQGTATSSLGLLTTNVAEGTNLYWTPERFDTRLSATTTLPNITTLASLSLSATQLTSFGTPFFSYFSATTTDALTEGATNKYYSDTLVNTYLHASTTLAKTYAANVWSALQTFTNASTTLFSNTGTAYFGGTATSTFDSAGNLALVSNGLTVGTNQFVVSGGNVGIGTTTPFRLLSMTSAVSTAQAAIAYDTANNTDILTSSVGDLFLYPSGNDALSNNSNFWVCTGGTGATNGCPSGTPTGFGNLIVETAVGVGSSTPFTALSLGANMAIVTTEKSLTDGATIAIDWKNGNQQVVTLGGNRAITFSNYISGATLRLVLCQDGTGSRTITSWPAAVLWSGGTAPTLTTTVNKCDVLTFLTTSATGTVRVLGSSVLNF